MNVTALPNNDNITFCLSLQMQVVPLQVVPYLRGATTPIVCQYIQNDPPCIYSVSRSVRSNSGSDDNNKQGASDTSFQRDNINTTYIFSDLWRIEHAMAKHANVL